MLNATEQKLDTAKSAFSGGPVWIEKAWEAAWALRISSVLLFSDLALIVYSRHGLLGWPVAGEDLLQNLGLVAVAVAVFGLLVAIVLPALEFFLKRFLNEFIWDVPGFSTLVSKNLYPRPYGYVSVYKVYQHAIEGQSAFLMKIYDDSLRRLERAERSIKQLGSLMFSTVCFSIADAWSPRMGWTDESLISAGLRATGTSGAFVWTSVVAVCSAFVVYAWFSDNGRHWIYYPSLANEPEVPGRVG
ncbi:hypothetical protein [Cupriavidus sp. D39]|uniref:hypothetical protein n=1 Tax=Cupriavidus sp. D39 TaxID=2997877 RepID=UPI00226DC799|nr:hypothetical protein [Cupriavidus sp. D39]MCY0858740.1 hypothetical protein [Cupriavidus sp. D39]